MKQLGRQSIEKEAGRIRVLTAQATTPVGVVDHGALGGLNDDDHPNYVHLSSARTVTAQHTFNHAGAPFALGVNSQGQLVGGLNADQADGFHFDQGVLTSSSPQFVGLTLSGNLSADGWGNIGGNLDVGGNLDLTGGFTIGGYVTGHLIPSLTDTYDVGSSTLWWRKGYLSELDAVIFAQNTVTLVGGWLIVGPGEGALAADVAAADTTVDFGQAMTTGHFVLFRAVGAVEYMTVGTVVSGTTYNVTRNLDGTGANDWPAGTPYSILGASGSGRIELNAYDTPRMSIITQGATYNAQTELIRLGDLNGSFGISSARYGIGIGDYSAGNYLRYDPTGGFVVKGGGGKVNFDADGITILVDSSSFYYLMFDDASTGDTYAAIGHNPTSNAFYIDTFRDVDVPDQTIYMLTNDFTVMGGSANTLLMVNATNGVYVKDNLYSVVWTSYSATSTITGWTSYTDKFIYYKKIGKLVFVVFYIYGVSDNTATNFTLPYTSANTSIPFDVIIRVQDNGTWATGLAELVANSNLLRCYSSVGGGSWTASGNKRVYGQLWYEATT